MQENEENIQDLEKCTVAIVNIDNNSVIGSGIIVTDNGLILTCYHVVENQRTKDLYKNVFVYFPKSKITKTAEVVRNYSSKNKDIVFLKLIGEIPNKSIIANLDNMVVAKEHSFQSFGFRNPLKMSYSGLWTRGIIQGKTRQISKDKEESDDIIQLKSNQIEYGMSGAPILDLETNGIVGIVNEGYQTRYEDAYKDLSFAIPITTILEVYPNLENENPGLSKINHFLKKIELDSIAYNNMDKLYVEPKEYTKMEKILEEYRIIFITGLKEYGKSYTAIHLLWKYYKKGYIPEYIPFEENSKNLSKIIDDLSNSNSNRNRKDHILYLEDPLGDLEYQSNYKFEKNIIQMINGLKDQEVYIIITMREGIFNLFHSFYEIIYNFMNFRFYIGKDSYDYSKRKDLLVKWANLKSCPWYFDERLKNDILDFLKNDSILPTPMSIRDFAISTSEKNCIQDDIQLLERLFRTTKGTALNFANEVKHMTKDKQIFLSFLFVGSDFKKDFIEEVYNKFVDLSDKNKTKTLFNKANKLFKDDRVVINGSLLSFAHHSYSEALHILLNDEDFKEIFIELLLKLYEYKDLYVAARLITTIIKNCKTLLDETFYIIKYYNDIANSENTTVNSTYQIQIAYALSNNITSCFESIPENYKNEFKKILIKLAENPNLSTLTCMDIAYNYNRLPKEIQDLLIKLAENPEFFYSLSFAISFFYKFLPKKVQDILLKLSKNKDIVKDIAGAIGENYFHLPDKIRNELIINIDKYLPSEQKYNGNFQNGALWEMNVDSNRQYHTKTISMSDIITIIDEYVNRIPDNSWMLYVIEIHAKQNLMMSLSLICQFDNQNYFEAIFNGKNIYRFNRILPIKGLSYSREIKINYENQTIDFILINVKTKQCETYSYPYDNLLLTSDIEITGGFSGVLWRNNISNSPFLIRYNVKISKLAYSYYNRLNPNDINIAPINILKPIFNESYKISSISYNGVGMYNGFLSYELKTGKSVSILKYDNHDSDYINTG